MRTHSMSHVVSQQIESTSQTAWQHRLSLLAGERLIWQGSPAAKSPHSGTSQTAGTADRRSDHRPRGCADAVPDAGAADRIDLADGFAALGVRAAGAEMREEAGAGGLDAASSTAAGLRDRDAEGIPPIGAAERVGCTDRGAAAGVLAERRVVGLDAAARDRRPAFEVAAAVELREETHPLSQFSVQQSGSIRQTAMQQLWSSQPGFGSSSSRASKQLPSHGQLKSDTPPVWARSSGWPGRAGGVPFDAAATGVVGADDVAARRIVAERRGARRSRRPRQGRCRGRCRWPVRPGKRSAPPTGWCSRSRSPARSRRPRRRRCRCIRGSRGGRRMGPACRREPAGRSRRPTAGHRWRPTGPRSRTGRSHGRSRRSRCRPSSRGSSR